MISSRHEVENQEHSEAQRREQEGGEERALLPLAPLERLVQDRAAVARRDAHEYVQEQHGDRKAPAVRRVHEPAHKATMSMIREQISSHVKGTQHTGTEETEGAPSITQVEERREFESECNTRT